MGDRFCAFERRTQYLTPAMLEHDDLSYCTDYTLIDDLLDHDISTTVKGLPGSMIRPSVHEARKCLRRVQRVLRAGECGISTVVSRCEYSPDAQEQEACRALGKAIPKSVIMPEREVAKHMGIQHGRLNAR
jgi:hypothetical protein